MNLVSRAFCVKIVIIHGKLQLKTELVLPLSDALGSSPVPSFYPLTSFFPNIIHIIVKYQVTYMYTIFSSAADCGTLNNPANGRVSYSGRATLGQTANYSYNRGYSLVGANTRKHDLIQRKKFNSWNLCVNLT